LAGAPPHSLQLLLPPFPNFFCDFPQGFLFRLRLPPLPLPVAPRNCFQRVLWPSPSPPPRLGLPFLLPSIHLLTDRGLLCGGALRERGFARWRVSFGAGLRTNRGGSGLSRGSRFLLRGLVGRHLVGLLLTGAWGRGIVFLGGRVVPGRGASASPFSLCVLYKKSNTNQQKPLHKIQTNNFSPHLHLAYPTQQTQ